MSLPRLTVLAAVLCSAVLVAAGCGGGGEDARKPIPSTTTSHAAQSAELVVGSTSLAFGGSEGSPPVVVPNLPGITVVGAGEAKGAPDKALLRLTIGSGNEFSGPEGVAPEPIEETEMQPVVQALEEAGAPEETIA